MSDVKDLFEQGEDVTDLFNAGETLDGEPVTQEDPNAFKAEPREYSQLEAFGIGAGGTPVGLGAGLTLGFGDEIGALFGAMGAKTGGDERSFGDVYRNIRDILREEKKVAEEQYPLTALSGELVGSLAIPMGAAGAAGKTGRGAVAASQIKKGRDIVKAGDAAIKEARILRELGKIHEVGKLGAKAGAVAGLGMSEAELTTGEPGQFLEAGKDMVGSAALGYGVGSGLQTLGKATSLGIDAVKSLPYIEDTLRIRELAKKGYTLAGKAKEISKEARDHAYNILNKLETLRTFTGTLVGKSREEADKLMGKIQIKDVIDNLRKEIDQLKPVGASEKADVENVKQVLSDILEETEKVHYKYLPKPQTPKASQADKAAQKVAKKTAEAEAKDKIKLEELYDALNRVTDPDEEANIMAQIKKIESGETQYPPQVINEELTELPVLGVSRGARKSPIVEAVPAEVESVFTPVQRVEVGREVLPTKVDATPGEISSHLQSLRDVPVETSKGQRAVGMAQEALKAASQKRAAEVGKPAQQAAEILSETTKGFGAIKDIQKSLGLPETGKVLNPSQEKNIVDSLQRAILGLTENKISSDRFAELTTELAEQFPQIGNEIRDIAKNLSERYQLSKMMSSQSLEGVKRGGLAIPAMLGRAAETGTRAEQAIKSGVTKLAKGVTNEVVDLGKRVHNASPQQIQRMSEFAAQKGGKFATETAKVLGSIVNQPMAKRRAVLFTLMQQPDFRDFARSISSSIFDESEGGEE